MLRLDLEARIIDTNVPLTYLFSRHGHKYHGNHRLQNCKDITTESIVPSLTAKKKKQPKQTPHPDEGTQENVAASNSPRSEMD